MLPNCVRMQCPIELRILKCLEVHAPQNAHKKYKYKSPAYNTFPKC